MSSDSNSDNSRPAGSLEGWVPDMADKAQLCKALDEAFDYRGDVTLTLRDGTVHAGYIFDRRTGQGLDDSTVRLLPVDSDERLDIPYNKIARLEFSGKDTAHGKSWETWLKKWAKKKAAGESANLYAEPLEE